MTTRIWRVLAVLLLLMAPLGIAFSPIGAFASEDGGSNGGTNGGSTGDR